MTTQLQMQRIDNIIVVKEIKMEKQTFTPAMVEEVEATLLGKKVKELEDVIETQKKSLKIGDLYNAGLYNGLVLAKSMLTGEEPNYYPEIKGGTVVQ